MKDKMKHTISFDGESRDIDIRLMDESFIVYRKMYRPPLTPENIGKVNPGDPPELFGEKGWHDVIRGFFRKQIRTIGSCGVLAWSGDGVIGKMYFTTKELYETFRIGGHFCVGYYCVEHDGMPRIIQSLPEEKLEKMLASPSKTLRIGCFNIGHTEERYQGKGIASAMIDLLKKWARKRGWKSLEALAYPDILPCVWAPHILRRGALERRGFHVREEKEITVEEIEQRRKYERLSCYTNYWLDKDNDKEYLMVFEL